MYYHYTVLGTLVAKFNKIWIKTNKLLNISDLIVGLYDVTAYFQIKLNIFDLFLNQF